MSWLPKSRTARRRLMVVAAAAPVVALAIGLTLFAMRDSISFFYTPSQALEAAVHRILTDQAMAARLAETSARMRSSPGPEKAAQLIAGLL